MVEYDGWIEGYKVRIFPWVDGKSIYCNVQYFMPGQGICQPSVWDKSVYITDNKKGRHVIKDWLHSLVNHIANMNIPSDGKVVITF